MIFDNISPLQGLFLAFTNLSTNIYAALPLKKAAEQRNYSHIRVLMFYPTPMIL